MSYPDVPFQIGVVSLDNDHAFQSNERSNELETNNICYIGKSMSQEAII